MSAGCLYAVALAAALLAPVSAMASQDQTCEDPMIRVDVADDGIARRACEAVARTKSMLAACDIHQRTPIVITVVEQANHPQFGDCLGFYDVKSACLHVTAPGRYPELLGEKDARRSLPPEVVFESLIVHEMVHVLVEQNDVSFYVSPAEHEFMASGFEMQSLAPKFREILLEADPVAPGGSMDLVNLGIYILAPRVFANNAWRIQEAQEGVCAIPHAIMEGENVFPGR